MKHISQLMNLPEPTHSQSEERNYSTHYKSNSNIPTGITRGNLKANGQIHTAPADFGTWFLSHLRRIGAEKSILSTDKNQNVMIVNSYYQDLVMNNTHFPNQYPYLNVLEAYSDAIVQLKIKLNGFNIRAHIEAFQSFIRESGQQYKDIEPRRYLPASGGSLNVDEQLQKLYGKNIPAIFHKYVTDKSIIK